MNQSDVLNEFNPDYSRKHGCAWFVWGKDKVREPDKTGGWASIGGEPAFRFSRPADLPKDIIWWTNLTKSEAWSIGRWSHIKHCDFLGPQWLTLMNDWGFPKNTDELKIYTSACAEILARLGEFLSKWSHSMSSSDNSPNPRWSWGDGDFHEALASKMGWIKPKENSHPALELAYVDMVEKEVPYNELENSRKVSLALPRVSHAKKILSSKFPSNDFSEVTPDIWPKTGEERWRWLENQEKPVLVRFDDITFRKGFDVEASLWWGLRGRRFASSTMESVWLTKEDAIFMRQWIDAIPSIALMASSWESFSMDEVLNWPSLNQGFLHDNSFVMGVLQECLWKAASSPARTPTKRIKSQVTPQSIWMRSMDLRLCFEEALKFQKSGFTVLSYGEGEITIIFNPKETFINHWIDTFKDTNILVPTLMAPYVEASSDINPYSLNIWFKSKGTIESWLLLDRLLWPWIGPDKKDLKPILEHALRSLASMPAPENANEEWLKVFKDELQLKSRLALKNVVAK